LSKRAGCGKNFFAVGQHSKTIKATTDWILAIVPHVCLWVGCVFGSVAALRLVAQTDRFEHGPRENAGFIEGIDQARSTLFPERLDDYISDENPVHRCICHQPIRTAY